VPSSVPDETTGTLKSLLGVDCPRSTPSRPRRRRCGDDCWLGSVDCCVSCDGDGVELSSGSADGCSLGDGCWDGFGEMLGTGDVLGDGEFDGDGAGDQSTVTLGLGLGTGEVGADIGGVGAGELLEEVVAGGETRVNGYVSAGLGDSNKFGAVVKAGGNARDEADDVDDGAGARRPSSDERPPRPSQSYQSSSGSTAGCPGDRGS
jgi:hypothetical protein